VQFSPDLRAGVLAGDVTVSFRLWKRPQVKVGGRYGIGDHLIEIDSIDLLPFGSVSTLDLRRTGDLDREVLRHRVAHAGPVADETIVFRVAFHVVRTR
jgi:hypothetical protein